MMIDITIPDIALLAFVVGFCGTCGVYIAAIAWDCIARWIGWS
jgi:hypothetical protein